MHPSGRTRPTPGRDGVLVHTTAPGSRDARSTYTWARLRRDRTAGTGRTQQARGRPDSRHGPRARRYATRLRYSTGLTPYTPLNAVDRANALP